MGYEKVSQPISTAPVRDKQAAWRTWSWMKMMYKEYEPWQVENWIACAQRKGWEIPGEMVRWLHEQEVQHEHSPSS